MSDIAIRVEGLSKQYHIGGKQERYRTLRDTIADTALAPFRRFRAALRHSGVVSANGTATIWALKDVSFEVKQGEVMGIIGRNGAGKSTLLKILSRITEPTTGSAEIYGRVASLLEVGTGFHPELTGRDNIYLNSAILGMRRAEVEGKFDEIVSFAEVEKFIDTPVKYYSSGMYLRLAFAVAAHLDPDILLVDEILAVGDITFQKKCLSKMGNVAHEGRPVLFVSHNMSAIRRLCTTAIMLQDGQVISSGAVTEVVEQYYRLAAPVLQTADRVAPGGSGFLSWECVGACRVNSHASPNNSPLEICARFRLARSMPVAFSLVVANNDDLKIVTINSSSCNFPVRRLDVGVHQVRFSFSSLPLVAGDYRLQFRIAEGHHVLLDEWDADPRLTLVSTSSASPDGPWRPVLQMMEHQVRMSINPEGLREDGTPIESIAKPQSLLGAAGATVARHGSSLS